MQHCVNAAKSCQIYAVKEKETLCKFECSFSPSSREEVEVIAVPLIPPDEADAGGLVQGDQASNDNVAL